ncbi:hypothetical protein [Arthrobacter burdickii]|uniref:Uncharacterized protein n=1 Tax=Arthrobacter burdickii TaxID=3035920 RepID=A0ABT8K214_9MICC|nr:hypothetical protein [Arthrobacter burdickii]MDN4611450.1 hypothetical protein [Arthrobacter burdickii]
MAVKYLKEVRATLFAILAIFLAMQLVVAVIQPYIVYILVGLVVLTVGWFFYSRGTRL